MKTLLQSVPATIKVTKYFIKDPDQVFLPPLLSRRPGNGRNIVFSVLD